MLEDRAVLLVTLDAPAFEGLELMDRFLSLFRLHSLEPMHSGWRKDQDRSGADSQQACCNRARFDRWDLEGHHGRPGRD